MNKTDIGLGTVSVVLAAVLAVLVYRWHAGQDLIEAQRASISELERMPAAREIVQAATVPSAARPVNEPAPSAPATMPAVNTAQPEPSRENPYADPGHRAAALRREKIRFRTEMRDLQQWGPLPEEKIEALINLMAEQRIQFLEAPYKNTTQPAGPGGTLAQRQSAEITALLGAEGLRQLKSYRHSTGGRRRIGDINSRLPASETLGSNNLRALADVLSQVEYDTWSTWKPPAYGDSMTNPDIRNSVAQTSMELTRQAAQRMREAAAPYLSQAQMAALDQSFREELDSLHANLELSRTTSELMQ